MAKALVVLIRAQSAGRDVDKHVAPPHPAMQHKPDALPCSLCCIVVALQAEVAHKRLYRLHTHAL